MTTNVTDEQASIYQEYRTAKKNLKRGRDFIDWMKVARGYDQARREAMHHAGTNVPQGAAYREHISRIARREKLFDRDDEGREFPSPEDRTYCIKVLENYDMPSYDPRRKSIKAWRDGLSDSERAKLNHPKRVWTVYWAATEPRAETEAKRKARELKQSKPDPMLDAVADAEAETHTARREIETLRELLALMRNAVELPGEIAAKIDAVLRNGRGEK
jgi:hypothetical protein